MMPVQQITDALVVGFDVAAIALMAATAVVLRAVKCPARKATWLRRCILTGCILFEFFAVAITILERRSPGGVVVLFVIVLLVRLVGLSLVRHGKVCDSCGSFAVPETFFSARKHCSKCGGKLDEGPDGTSGWSFAFQDRSTDASLEKPGQIIAPDEA